jgi:transposase InsO family protein
VCIGQQQDISSWPSRRKSSSNCHLPSLYPGPEFCLDGAAYTATSVARAFFAEIVRLHGLPSSIVSDRDATFTSTFWRELFCLFGVHLNMSAAFHPQSHGQSEAVNKIITMYLRCLSGDRPHQWVQWLPWAKFCYNSAYQSSLQTTPFCVIYGRDPPAIPPYTPSAVRVPAVDQ